MFLFLAAIYDLKMRIIPNFIPVALIFIGIIYILLCSLENGFSVPLILSHVYGFVASLLICTFCRLLSKKGLGMGDLKLLGALGFVLGINEFLQSLFITALASFLMSVCLLCLHCVEKKASLPFAPFIVLGVVVSESIKIILEVS